MQSFSRVCVRIDFIVFNKWIEIEWFMTLLICSFVCCGFVTDCQWGRLLGHVFHMLGTYVIILCNWLILWQNALYLYLGRSRMCLILKETLFQDQVLKPCKSIQDSSWENAYHLSSTASIYRALKAVPAPWLDSNSTNSYLLRFKKNRFFCSVSFKSVITCLGFLFSQT